MSALPSPAASGIADQLSQSVSHEVTGADTRVELAPYHLRITSNTLPRESGLITGSVPPLADLIVRSRDESLKPAAERYGHAPNDTISKYL